MPTASLTFSSDHMHLSGILDFVTVVSLQTEGDTWLREQAPANCTLDMSGVTQSNSAGTALLLAWLRTAGSSGKSLDVEHIPENLRALMELAGLEHLMKARGLVPGG
jgi:phospholipid transport system transporter-binding protein